jgi:hypothetical protein
LGTTTSPKLQQPTAATALLQTSFSAMPGSHSETFAVSRDSVPREVVREPRLEKPAAPVTDVTGTSSAMLTREADGVPARRHVAGLGDAALNKDESMNKVRSDAVLVLPDATEDHSALV